MKNSTPLNSPKITSNLPKHLAFVIKTLKSAHELQTPTEPGTLQTMKIDSK